MGGPKILARFLVIGFVAMAVGIVVVTALLTRPPLSDEIAVRIEQLDGATARITWTMPRPVEALRFNKLPGRYRAGKWTFEDPSFELRYEDNVVLVAHSDRKPFQHVVVISAAGGDRLPKEYHPLALYGDGGVLAYTGHFHPIDAAGARLDAAFDMVAADGGKVVAFGTHAPSLANWVSPLAHPAFAYFGPLEPIETDHVIALVDPQAPQWIADDFDELTPKAFDYFADAFGNMRKSGPSMKPNLFMAARLGNERGRLSYSGDALPGQFQITLEGGAWAQASSQGEDVFRRSTLHEAFHLWQSAAAVPDADDSAAWIHEGGADAVAVDAMIALGFWGADDLSSFEAVARRDCVAGLRDGALADAHGRGDFSALYACGFLIAEAVARRDGATATAFWRNYMTEAQSSGGYGEDLYYQLIAKRTGDEDFAQTVKYFVRTPLAEPGREIDRLFAPARPASPLAPRNGR